MLPCLPSALLAGHLSSVDSSPLLLAPLPLTSAPIPVPTADRVVDHRTQPFAAEAKALLSAFPTGFLDSVLSSYSSRAAAHSVRRPSRVGRYWIDCKHKSHGKQWIARRLRTAHSLSEVPLSGLPHDKLVFMFLQKEYAYSIDSLCTPECWSSMMPCVAFLPTQYLICDKVHMARSLHSYFGEEAWSITPRTVEVHYSFDEDRWLVDEPYVASVLAVCHSLTHSPH